MKMYNVILIIVCLALVATAVYFSAKKSNPDSLPEIKPGKDFKLPRGLRNNNPGNLKFSRSNAWRGKIPESENSDLPFEQFDKIQNGARAQLVLLRNYIHKGLNTVEKIINVYTPPFDIQLGEVNPTKKYIETVAKEMGISKDDIIDADDKEKLIDLAYEIGMFENANHPLITRRLYESAYEII